MTVENVAGVDMGKWILDVCCGGRMFWFDKNEPHTIFMDNRVTHEVLCDERKFDINPDIIGDFRDIPFGDDTFYLVVFDPPHLIKVGEKSWLAKKYGKLSETWQEDLRRGFSECMRVLKPYGILVFKWNEEQIEFRKVLKVIGRTPLFGDRRGKTRWVVFMKQQNGNRGGSSDAKSTKGSQEGSRADAAADGRQAECESETVSKNRSWKF